MNTQENEAKVYRIAYDECHEYGMHLKDITYIYEGLRLASVVLDAWSPFINESLARKRMRLTVNIPSDRNMYEVIREKIGSYDWKVIN